jgi:hypothetical protein
VRRFLIMALTAEVTFDALLFGYWLGTVLR